MAIEAVFSKFKKNNLKIYIAACIVVAVILAYDGYLSKYEWSKRQSFYKEHVIDNNDAPDGTMAFNRNVPFALIVVAVLFRIKLAMIKDKKVVADDNNLIANKQTIAYNAIEKIDKTNLESKGYVLITYKDSAGKEAELKLSDRTYDNLPAVLDIVVAKIS